MTMVYNELMKSFAAKCGLSNLIIDGDIAAIKIDGITMGFLNDAATDTLTIVADLGQRAINSDGAFGSMMLKAHYLFQSTKGATIYQHPDNGAFGLQQRYRLIDLDGDTLYSEVEKLANLADDWKAILDGCEHAEAEAAKRKSEEPASASLSMAGGGFMRV